MTAHLHRRSLFPLLAAPALVGLAGGTPALAATATVPPLGLAQGWPSAADVGDDELRVGPKRAIRPLTLFWDGAERQPAEAEDRVGARYVQPEDFRGREARAYATEAAARRAAFALVEVFRDTPSWSGDGFTYRAGVGGAPTWREGARIATWARRAGADAVGTGALVVVQRRNLVLTAVRGEEGMGSRAAWRLVNAEATEVAPIIRRMER